jgi:hypothetical protein
MPTAFSSLSFLGVRRVAAVGIWLALETQKARAFARASLAHYAMVVI